MSLLDEFKTDPSTIFIAYSFPYIEQAIEALESSSKKVEAVIVQPYKEESFVSARNALNLYRRFREDRNIPILFTRQPRTQEQFFEYGSYLLDVRDREEESIVEQNMQAGKWLMWDDKLYAKNFLIVKKPIVRLPEQFPISIAINILPGDTQGEDVRAIAIPAPKRIKAKHKKVLEIESFEMVGRENTPTKNLPASIEEDEAIFPEGKEVYRVHRSRERSSKVVEIVKRNRITTDPLLHCEVCGFSFAERYGELGKGFIEAHHTIPLSQQLGEVETKAEDIALVCPNCHRMLHRCRPWLEMPKLKKLIKSSKAAY